MCISFLITDPDSGAHTQQIESTWWAIKRHLPRTHTRHDKLSIHLMEYMWRIHHKKHGHDLFFQNCTFINTVKKQ